VFDVYCTRLFYINIIYLYHNTHTHTSAAAADFAESFISRHSPMHIINIMLLSIWTRCVIAYFRERPESGNFYVCGIYTSHIMNAKHTTPALLNSFARFIEIILYIMFLELAWYTIFVIYIFFVSSANLSDFKCNVFTTDFRVQPRCRLLRERNITFNLLSVTKFQRCILPFTCTNVTLVLGPRWYDILFSTS